MSQKIKASIIIPAYNEERNIYMTLRQICEFANQNLSKYEIIVVDDGSSDLTAWLVNVFKRHRKPNISLLSNETNKGKGYSIKKGLLNSKYYIKVTIDADYSIPLQKEFFNFSIYPKNQPFVIVGLRKIHNYSLMRRFLHSGFRLFAETCIGKTASDPQCPLKIYYKPPFELFQKMRVNGYAHDLELLQTFKLSQIPIYDMNVTFIHNPNSHLKPKHISKMAFDTLKLIKNAKTR